MNQLAEPRSVLETRLTHETHRRASALLADAANSRSADPEALTHLRDFLVATLHHHHESEDHVLWPLIEATAPGSSAPLVALGEEHEELERKLRALAEAPVPAAEPRDALAEAARDVRDLVHRHLEHEEPVLFPALREHLTAEQWDEFSLQVVSTTPPVGALLMIGFVNEFATQQELDAMMSGLPATVLEMAPVMAAEAAKVLAAVRG
ncbi:hemerythrin domain-containing protein [Streptomyces sp. NPDC047841]|uniref:hemerythrin domain-containing protein n=1 Tax=Streptomyces sp. NPDC047841 TaxID=3154708 RepID=UPI00345129EA